MSSHRKPLSIALVFVLLATPILAQQNAGTNDYSRGLVEGQNAAQGNGVWFWGGCGLNLTGVILAYVLKPSPPGGAMLGKSPEYIMGFTEGYGNKSRDKNVSYAIEGCCVFWVAYAGLYAVYVYLLAASY